MTFFCTSELRKDVELYRTHLQGYSVEASGSSKKIAKNTAAKLMLDLLEEKEGQSKLVQNTKNKIINVAKNYVKETPLLNTHLDGDAGVKEISKVYTNDGLDTNKTTTKGFSEVMKKLSMGTTELKEEVLKVSPEVVGGASREGSCAEHVGLEVTKPPLGEGGPGGGLREGGPGGGLPVGEFYQAMRASDGEQVW